MRFTLWGSPPFPLFYLTTGHPFWKEVLSPGLLWYNTFNAGTAARPLFSPGSLVSWGTCPGRICQKERTIFVKSLFRYMADYKKECILGPLFKLLEASFELLVPLVMAAVIDVGIQNRDVPYIWRMCLLMAALGVVGLVCSITAQYFAAKASVGVAAKLRRALFAHIQELSFSDMDTAGTSTLIT